MESYQFEKFENNEAHALLRLKVTNDNWFNIKIIPSFMTVSADGRELGTLHLAKKVKIKGKKSDIYDARIRFKFSDGALFSLPALMAKEEVKLTFEGKVKGKVFIFGKKIHIREEKNVNLKSLQLNFFP